MSVNLDSPLILLYYIEIKSLIFLMILSTTTDVDTLSNEISNQIGQPENDSLGGKYRIFCHN